MMGRNNMMGRRRAFVVGAVLGSLALVTAACSSGGGRSATALPTASTSSPASAATIAVASSSLGDVLVDAQGRTLYLFGADRGTKSACSGACAVSWPPLVTSGTPTVENGAATSLVATATRSGGQKQVIYNGHPLYLFAGDQKAGDTNGQGVDAFGASWYALTSTGNQVTTTPPSTGGGNGY
ncbi:MAG: hypothetical protein QOJ19_4106 [Acidimicrobiia bacterium]|jgi:predicted lipoprotein with Yx(FWY)xxD motif|nr:hypothetical protein [Acidimicrobiia bacterium]